MKLLKSNFFKTRQRNKILRNELEILRSLYLKINVDMNLDHVLDEIIFTLREKIDFDGCNVSLIDDDGFMRIHKIDMSKISKKSNLTEAFLDKIYSQKFDFNNCNNWTVISAREKKEIYFPDISKKSLNEEENILIENYGITGLYYLPIYIGDKVFGTMRFHNYGGTMYLNSFEKELIRGRVALIARALENLMLYNNIKKNNEIIKLDMELAHRIQQNLLPRGIPAIDNLEIVTEYNPMYDVGGDYFDFLMTRNNKNSFGMIITDASGHGIPAAFITSMVKMSFQSDIIRKLFDKPASLLKRLNKSLYNKIAENFVTGIYCYFNLKEMKMRISSAGHNPLIKINRLNGRLENINPRGKALALIDDIELEETEISINKGDRFFLYTDGLTEAVDRDGNFFEEKLMSLLVTYSELDATNLSQLINGELRKHALHDKKTSFNDDIAFIIIDIK